MFKKILIANRGEIALRIIRACRELGLQTVAVYSEADHLSLHVRFADEAICIGPPDSNRSYLNIPSIIAAAELTNADAIHPGYGFLAENDNFSAICRDQKIHFIGPPPETISAMGDKAQAKKTMHSCGVTVIPGSEWILESPQQALELAESYGYPVLLKATAGGGGRGMRLVDEPGQMEPAFLMAQNESLSAFQNGGLYLEKFVEKPRHIEVQILADEFAQVATLGERECSVQRRHQKLLEETPSPAVTPEIRRELYAAAARGVKAVGYVGAGTVEFLLDSRGGFYFMEMNTRIQVEHPITEMVFGTDLIKHQICCHAGLKIPEWMLAPKLRGHSIECRINAEDPNHNFRPSPGEITSFHMPGGNGVRVDTHAYAGYVIPPFYDSMIAKLVVHGPDRDTAIARMRGALDECVIEGIKTSIPFHRQLLLDEKFVSGDYDTGLLETFEYQPYEDD